MHVGHSIDQLTEQLIGLFLGDLVIDEIREGALLAEFQKHEDPFRVELVAKWAIEIHDVFVFELTHDLYFFELAWREAIEVNSLDLFDCDESSGLVVVASVNGAEWASAQADEAIVDEALGDLSVAC